MTGRVLLAIGQEELRNQSLATFAELGDDIEVLGVAETAADALLMVDTTPDIDVVVIHDQIGALPYLALIKELLSRVPDLAVLVMSSAPSVASLQAIMDAGGRGVTESPPSHDELLARLPGVLAWRRQIRANAAVGLGFGSDKSGRLIAFTGAKGGVGTSTLALHTAILAAVSDPERRVCLLDLDLQMRGVRQLVDVSARRTIADLVTVSEALTGRNLDEAVVVHRSGLRILMAPDQGEQAEDITGEVTRHIVGVAKAHFDLVIVDAGSVITDASAVGMEFADTLVMVTTPDVACIRAAQDKLELLNRLQIAKLGDAVLLFNKVTSKHEVQPEFGARMTSAEAMSTSIPEDWKHLESASNALAPLEVDDGGFRRALVSLGTELGVNTRSATAIELGKKSGRGRRRAVSEAGQVTIEALVGIVVALIIFLVLLQVVVLAIGTVTSRRAADEAARVGARGGTMAEVQQAADDTLIGFFRVQVSAEDSTTYSATVTGPVIVPGFDREITATSQGSEEG